GRDQVGDALIKLPFLRGLRNAFPKAEITWITAQGPTAFSNILREPTRNLIDVIHEKPEWMGDRIRDSGFGKAVLPQIPNPESRIPDAPYFDLLIDTRNRWREALYAKKIPHKLFLTPALRYLPSEKRPFLLQPKKQHMVDR